MGAHTWSCPACGRSVPLRVPACHCGLGREQAQERAAAEEAAFLAEAAPSAVPETATARPRRAARNPHELRWATLPGDVKALLAGAALVALLGMGWLFFGPAPAPIAPVLGYVDSGPPPAPKPTPRPRPAFKLPWWK